MTVHARCVFRAIVNHFPAECELGLLRFPRGSDPDGGSVRLPAWEPKVTASRPVGCGDLLRRRSSGSIAQTTNTSGTVNATACTYDPYGGLQTGVSNGGFAFTGREWDPETSLYYYRASYYDPNAGRFLSEDPIGIRGGINLYQYAWANPVVFSDPDGRCGAKPLFPDPECITR
jgi:RHS repeat-associated protein